jgi:hypothetical protein
MASELELSMASGFGTLPVSTNVWESLPSAAEPTAVQLAGPAQLTAFSVAPVGSPVGSGLVTVDQPVPFHDMIRDFELVPAAVVPTAVQLDGPAHVTPESGA